MANNITTESDEGGKERERKGEREERREGGKERGRKGEREEQGGRERGRERVGEINSIPHFPGQRMKCLACNIL